MNNRLFLIISIVLFLFISTILEIYADDSIEIKKIELLLFQQRDDWNSGNLEKYMNGYWNSDSLLFIGKNGPKYGWNNTLQNYKKSYPDKSMMGILEFNLLKINVLSEHDAFVIGNWSLKRNKDNPSGYFSLVLKKINGIWKIIIDHSS